MTVDAHFESVVVDVFNEYPHGLPCHYVTCFKILRVIKISKWTKTRNSFTGSPSKISFSKSIVSETRAEKMRKGNVVRRQELPQIIHDKIPEKTENL